MKKKETMEREKWLPVKIRMTLWMAMIFNEINVKLLIIYLLFYATDNTEHQITLFLLLFENYWEGMF